MTGIELFFYGAGIISAGTPLLLLLAVGIPPIFGQKLSEQTTSSAVFWTVLVGLMASISTLALMLITGERKVPIELGHWISIPEQHFHFHLKLVFDRLSIPILILTYLLCGIVGAFTTRYLHREPGFNRFYIAYVMFMSGMILAILAGTIELLFFGWELVGLSSALLIAFFHERRNPVQSGFMAWCIYRIADAAFLAAAIAMHHMTGQGDFEIVMGSGAWPDGQASLAEGQAVTVGLLLIVAAAGKSALVPFSGWLPRAMEGPTSSSAIFYGALSVHLGAYLLLRISPILELSYWLSGTVIVLGLLTAVYASLAGRVQADIKTTLAFASLTQVGIIVVEIGLGLRYIALIHILGHAALRTLQLLRAPTLLHDYKVIENALEGHVPKSQIAISKLVPRKWGFQFYRLSVERFYLDELLHFLVVRPFLSCFRLFNRLERGWMNFLSGDKQPTEQTAQANQIQSHELIEEMRQQL